jgi:hypothetical protein
VSAKVHGCLHALSLAARIAQLPALGRSRKLYALVAKRLRSDFPLPRAPMRIRLARIVHTPKVGRQRVSTQISLGRPDAAQCFSGKKWQELVAT